MRNKITIGIAVTLLTMMGVTTTNAEQCPAGSGKYCPAGTYCEGNMCVKEDYSQLPPPPQQSLSLKSKAG